METAEKRVSKKFQKLTIAVLVVGLLGAGFIIPLPPEGKFTDKYIGCLGIAYLEFKDGEAFLRVPLGLEPSEGYHTDILGTYANENGQWILKTGSTNEFILKATLLSIHISDPKAKPDSIYANMVHPRMMFWDK